MVILIWIGDGEFGRCWEVLDVAVLLVLECSVRFWPGVVVGILADVGEVVDVVVVLLLEC